MTERPLVIGYDGSDGAAHAIDVARSLVGPGPATVVTTWNVLLVGAPLAGEVPGYLRDIEPKLEEHVHETAKRGAALARDAGFDVDTLVKVGDPAWLGLCEAAEELDARAIVVGARGLTGLKSMVLGSTSNGVLHHTNRPVLVVRRPADDEQP